MGESSMVYLVTCIFHYFEALNNAFEFVLHPITDKDSMQRYAAEIFYSAFNLI